MNSTPLSAAYYRGNKTFAVETASQMPPAKDEVSIRVAYCGVCGTDMHAFRDGLDPRYVTLPVVLGHECSGEVVSTGEDVTSLKQGSGC